MTEWLQSVAAWLQSWLGADAGLWGLFFSALLSATVLPGSSEVVLTALVTAYPDIAWTAAAVATLGNVVGCLITFAMGHGAREGWQRFQRVKVDMDNRHVQRLRRRGPPVLFLSFLPLVGDALVLAAGWLRMPFWQSMAWIAAGKATRYVLLVLGLKGVFAMF